MRRCGALRIGSSLEIVDTGVGENESFKFPNPAPQLTSTVCPYTRSNLDDGTTSLLLYSESIRSKSA